VIAASFVSAFVNYDGPKPQLANLTAKPQARVINYLESMDEANRTLRNSINSFARTDGGDGAAAINSLDNGISSLNRAPSVDEQADLLREKLLNLLTEYKAVVQNRAESDPKGRRKTVDDHNAVVKKYDAFLAEYNSWLPKFLEAHGLRLEQPDGNQ
jgi:hypothetical protein